jgi:protein gp37
VDTTKISWTDKTWSPWQGCTKVSPGCDHCYAENIADTRFHIVQWGPGKPRKHTENWDSPRRWQKQAAKAGTTIRVFPSMCDPFDNEVSAEWRTRFFTLIRETPNLTWLILTKRIGNANKMLRESGAITRNGIIETPLANLWLGATCVNQEEADRDIPKLLATPAAKRFVSYEPALGAVDFSHINKDRETNELNALSAFTWAQEIEAWTGTSEEWQDDFEDFYGIHPDAASGPMHATLDLIIAGGESGAPARPAHPDWFRSVRDQCAAAGVPFHFKQWGEWHEAFHEAQEDDGSHLQVQVGTDVAESAWSRGDRLISLDGDILDHPDKISSAKPYRLMERLGTKKSGRHLDGREHLEFPK